MPTRSGLNWPAWGGQSRPPTRLRERHRAAGASGCCGGTLRLLRRALPGINQRSTPDRVFIRSMVTATGWFSGRRQVLRCSTYYCEIPVETVGVAVQSKSSASPDTAVALAPGRQRWYPGRQGGNSETAMSRGHRGSRWCQTPRSFIARHMIGPADRPGCLAPLKQMAASMQAGRMSWPGDDSSPGVPMSPKAAIAFFRQRRGEEIEALAVVRVRRRCGRPSGWRGLWCAGGRGADGPHDASVMKLLWRPGCTHRR